MAVVKPAPAPQQNQVYFIQADHLNAPRVILNNANIPVWRWDTADAFGTTPPNADPDGDGNTFEYNLRFPGQYYDKETGLHYNYFRDYDPSTGRYIESDPIGLKGGLNTYTYVGNNPVNYTDSTGLVIDTVVDVVSLGLSVQAYKDDPSLTNGLGLTYDALATAIPGLPAGFGIIKNVGSKACKVASPNQLNKQIQRGLAPKEVQRVDIGKVIGEQTHVHFDDGSALNIDGTWKHGESDLSNSVKDWLQSNGWTTPK
ncbi:MAG: RHS repeat-associated core domain-containing protein [Methylococcaceae bacterium]|nr:RHS repeat-associated core domain-containing protein [Methylococcaceae bacterium]